MPELSRFFGICVAMFANEHNPPHFHAIYAGRKAAFNIRTLAMTEGSLPPRARGLIIEWASLHQQELLMLGMNFAPVARLRKLLRSNKKF
jgi:hypothetical protein